MIDFDVETTGLQPYSGAHHAFSYQFYDGTDAVYFEYDYQDPDPEVRAEIQRWFDRAKTEGIRAWNSKFDWSFAEQAGFDVPDASMWHDGMIVAHAIDERRSVALKAIAKSLFGEDADALQRDVKDWLNAENRRRRKVIKDASKAKTIEAAEQGDLEAQNLILEAKSYQYDDGDMIHANFSDVPSKIMEHYGLEDVLLTRRVADHFEGVLENQPSLRRVIEFERETMGALYDIEKRGLPADEHGYRRLEIEVLENLEALEDTVMGLAREGDPAVYAKALKAEPVLDEDTQEWIYPNADLANFKPQSTAQILAALKARGADLSYMSEKEGKVGADADNLRAVDDPLAAAILEFRSEYKVLSTYVRPMIGRTYETRLNSHKEQFIAPDGRIHATYRQIGARTGRMSCADPNMQNQPRDDLRLRYNIVAEEGHCLVCCDLSNIEMVLFAAYCGEGDLLDAVMRGDDLHVMTAERLGFRDRLRPGGGYESARQQGKVYNFTRIYGGGLRSIKRYFRCSMDQARIYKRRFDDAYPEVGRLQTRIDLALENNGYIQDQLISGRRFRVDQRESYKATNYLVQGTAAALLKYAVMQLYKDGIPMVALVHDEIVAHVPISDALEAGKLIEQRMTEFEGLKGVVPIRAEADYVKRWSDAKPLKAEDQNGRPYFFTPKWAGGERRWVDEQKPLVKV